MSSNRLFQSSRRDIRLASRYFSDLSVPSFLKLPSAPLCYRRSQVLNIHSFVHINTCVGTFSSSSLSQRANIAKKHVQVSRRSRKKNGQSSTLASATRKEEGLVDAMQGEWGDDIGLTISITGRQAKFSDGPSVYHFEETADGIVLRGAKLVGTTQHPIWKFPWGVERRWARSAPSGIGDEAWSKAFHLYKHERLNLRKKLREAIVAHDFEQMSAFRAAWESSTVPMGKLTPSQRENLESGSHLVTGKCIHHRRFGYRGVLVASEPWCTAPVHWRAQMGVPALPRGEAQPFYHCIVDTRDRPGAQMTFCSEENIEPADVAFPIESPLLDDLLQKSNEIGGYLPTAKLEAALWKQRNGSKFEI